MGRFFKGNIITIILFIVLAFRAFTDGRFLNDPLGWLIQTALLLPGIIIGITFHEWAHAFVAYKLGDRLPKEQKRVSLNPVRHVDPIGFIALIFIGFGWGRPVEVNPYAFKRPRLYNFLVDIAGVTTNFILAWIFVLSQFLLVMIPEVANSLYTSDTWYYVFEALKLATFINIVLMVFNLLPVPPLDGFGIITEIFNLRNKDFYPQLYNAGFPILILLIMLNVPARVISPIIETIFSFIYQVVGTLF